MLTNGDENVMPAGVDEDPLFEVIVNKPAGIILLTKNKFCDKNILVKADIPVYNGEIEDVGEPDEPETPDMATVTITNNSDFTIGVDDTDAQLYSVSLAAGETKDLTLKKGLNIIIYAEDYSPEDGYTIEVSDITGDLRRYNNETFPVYLTVDGDGSFTVNVVAPTTLNETE